MKKQSRTVPRRRQSESPSVRHLPLVEILIDTQPIQIGRAAGHGDQRESAGGERDGDRARDGSRGHGAGPRRRTGNGVRV